jgi:hypothetical protein
MDCRRASARAGAGVVAVVETQNPASLRRASETRLVVLPQQACCSSTTGLLFLNNKPVVGSQQALFFVGTGLPSQPFGLSFVFLL